MADDVNPKRHSAACIETQTIGTPPLTVTLGCRRPARHTGKHVTPDGDAQWWGPTDRQMAERQACNYCESTACRCGDEPPYGGY